MEMAMLRNIHWDMLLVQDIEIREALLMADQMVRFLEDLTYVIILYAQMGRLLANWGKVHWEG